MKRIFTAVLALAFLTGTVSLGVHLMRKDAFAATTFEMEIVWDQNPQDGLITEWKMNADGNTYYLSYASSVGNLSTWKVVVNPDPGPGDWVLFRPQSDFDWDEDDDPGFPWNMGAIDMGGMNWGQIHQE